MNLASIALLTRGRGGRGRFVSSDDSFDHFIINIIQVCFFVWIYSCGGACHVDVTFIVVSQVYLFCVQWIIIFLSHTPMFWILFFVMDIYYEWNNKNDEYYHYYYFTINNIISKFTKTQFRPQNNQHAHPPNLQYQNQTYEYIMCEIINHNSNS